MKKSVGAKNGGSIRLADKIAILWFWSKAPWTNKGEVQFEIRHPSYPRLSDRIICGTRVCKLKNAEGVARRAGLKMLGTLYSRIGAALDAAGEKGK